MRIDEEQSEYFPVSRLGRVLKLKWLDLVLQNVGEGKQPSLSCFDGTNILDWRTVRVAAKDVRKPSVVLLRIVYCRICGVIRMDELTECQVARRDVLTIIII